MMSLCLPLFSACGSDGEPAPVCDSSYIPNCNDTNTAIVTCRQNPETKIYQLVETRCDYGCEPLLNQCKAAPQVVDPAPDTKCTDATHPRACKNDNSGYTWCEAGEMKEASCNGDQICDPATAACVPNGGDVPVVTGCTDETLPPSCNGSVLTFCKNGAETTVTCGGTTTCDAASKSCKPNSNGDDQPATVCDPATYKPECVTPHKLRTCVNGKYHTETCDTGTICNAMFAEKSCRAPVKGDSCSPDSFAESCTNSDKSTVFCDEDTHKVVFYDCTKEVGDNYRCDIAENFYGDGLDVTMCYDPKDRSMICTSEDDSYSKCEYDAKDDAHYTTTYQCAKFNLGYHFYVADVEECGAGACNGDNTACKK